MEKILGIYGAGGLGREVLELAKIINTKLPQWDRIIFIIDNPSIRFINDVRVYSYSEIIESNSSNIEMILAIGEPLVREQLYNKVIKDNLILTTLIHPDVYIPSTTTIGKGTVINLGCFISCNVIIKDNVYIQPTANIGHDCVLEEGVVVSSFGNLAGNVCLGKYTYVGMNTCIKEKTSVGDYSIIGMGSVVNRDIPSNVIALGNPARPMKKNEEKKIFK